MLTTFALIPKGYSKNTLSVKDSSINTTVSTDELSEILRTWIIKNEAQYYKNISIATTPVKVEIKDSKIEGTFTVTVSEVLKAITPEELPAIRGMERFRDLKKGELSPSQNNAVNKELTSWITELKGYIGKTETLNIDFKVVADLSEAGSILLDTVNFFADNSMGDFYKIYSLVPTADEMEEEGFNHAKEIADKAKDAAFSQTSQYCYTVDEYRRCDPNNPPDPAHGVYGDYNNYAANYADRYTNDHGNFDTDNYNLANYVAYQNPPFNGSDCANFVSQAMFAGGIPMSTTHDVEHWWYDSSNLPPDYAPWIWTTAVKENNNWGLRNYMYYNGYWADSDLYWANAGSVMMWTNSSDSPGHVAMIVQNDTINRALSAHTNNHQHLFYSEGSYFNNTNMDFYTVHHYVTYCYASQPGTPK
ncbi:amidase domain-containing protein [Caldisericum exile]|uniref:amidase domain-containing protein n=1 Tax=Caldisericum exile TaxID=693075 RepID=UPI00155A1C1F|nr:amidase domain-containing protein [Caldisericum exile]